MTLDLARTRKVANEAYTWTKSHFPFQGYLDNKKEACIDVAVTVLQYVPEGSRILDFGAGPCDKTAIVQRLGFVCSAADDLQDDWHAIGDNRQKILSFAKEIGIDFRFPNKDGSLPFEPEFFDMIMMHDVLEHLHDSPRLLLNECLRLLKPSGYLFITVPSAVDIRKRLMVFLGRTNLPRFNLFYWYPGKWRGHVREYVKDDLKELCHYLNVTICELSSANHHIPQVLPRYLCPIYRIATSLFPCWRDTLIVVARKDADWKPRTQLSPEELRKVFGRSTNYDYSS